MFNRDQFSANDAPKPIVDEYSPRIADEPFLVGTAKHLRERFEIIAQTFDITLAEAKEYPIYNEATGKEELTFPGLGESGLRVIDALQRVGDMTAQELADETGKKISSIRTALRKLVQHGIVEATRESAITPYTYSLAPDALRLVDAIAPTLRTHKMTSYREDKRIEEAQQYAVNGYAQAKEQGDQVKESRIEERFMKLAKARMTHLRRINVNMTTEQIEDKYRVYGMLHAYKYQTVNPSDPELFKPNVRTQETKAAFRNQRRDLQKTWEAEHSDNIRMIRELAYVTIDEFKAQGLRKPTRRMVVREIMKYGTFDETTVSAVIASSKQMADYRPLGGAA